MDEYDESEPPVGACGDMICACGETEDVTWNADPYVYELYDEEVWDWWCPQCYADRADDI